MSTKHPCAGLSTLTKSVFEGIACGFNASFHPATIKSLLAAELVVQIGERIVGQDNFGTIKVAVYEVPLAVHMQWCAWCAENVVDDDLL